MAAQHRMSAVRFDPAASDDDVARLRVPPHSREAEQSVIGALMLDGTAAWPAVSGVVSEADFYSYEHRLIFGAASTLLTAGRLADPITVLEQLQGRAEECGGLSYLTALATAVPGISGANSYAQIVRERAVRRRLIAATDEIATAAFNPQGRDLAGLLAEAESSLQGIAAAAPKAQSMLVGLGELEQRAEAVSWVVKHAIPGESVGIMFGGPGTFKSYIALDLALHVANGLPWLGRRTRQAPVIYIAAEGGTGLWGRVKAWHTQRRRKVDESPLYVAPVALDVMQDAGKLAAEAKRAGIVPGLVVVDTLSQTFSGEENSANEVAAYLRALGVSFREQWRCAVLVIHHTGHAATERPRGSSAIKGNVDFMLGVHRDEKEMVATVECARQKDGQPFGDVTFYLSSVGLGVDADGDQVAQLVASHIKDGAEAVDIVRHEATKGRGGRNALFLDLLKAMEGQSEKEVRTAFYARADIDNDAAKRQAWKRAVDWAARNGLAVFDHGTLRVLKRVE